MIKTAERGWGGHYCCAHYCYFRRNTLVYDDENHFGFVVSTVGNMNLPEKSLMRGQTNPVEIGCGRHYETMVFDARLQGDYMDADVACEHSEYFYGLAITEDNKNHVDNIANWMHEIIVEKVIQDIKAGKLKPVVKEQDN